MTTAERLAAREEFSASGTHSESCAYIETLSRSFDTRPRGPVSDCNCWNGKILAAVDDAEKRIVAAREEIELLISMWGSNIFDARSGACRALDALTGAGE